MHEPYRDRPIERHGVRDIAGWRLKLYSIRYGAQPIDLASFEDGMALMARDLPQPPRTATRPGVGFVILHRGRGMSYVVAATWGNENELRIRVAVRGADEPGWRPARDDESFCVWDLQVMAAEREAYVRRVMTTEPDVEGYLE